MVSLDSKMCVFYPLQLDAHWIDFFFRPNPPIIGSNDPFHWFPLCFPVLHSCLAPQVPTISHVLWNCNFNLAWSKLCSVSWQHLSQCLAQNDTLILNDFTSLCLVDLPKSFLEFIEYNFSLLIQRNINSFISHSPKLSDSGLLISVQPTLTIFHFFLSAIEFHLL